MGFTEGFLGVFNIQTNQSIKNFKVLTSSIYSMACKPDNTGAYINDYSGAVRLITWKENPSKKDDFDLSEEPRRGPAKRTKQICLTQDSKKLFVCAKDMVRLCWPLLLSSTKEYETNFETKRVMQIKNGKQVLLVNDIELRVCDFETFRLKSHHRPLDFFKRTPWQVEWNEYPQISNAVL